MEKKDYRVIITFDFEEDGRDITGLELKINEEKMKDFEDNLVLMLEDADAACDNYIEDENGDEVRRYDDGHNVNTLLDYCKEKGYIEDYTKVFELNSYDSQHVYFENCDYNINF